MNVAALGMVAIRPAARADLGGLVTIERASFSDPWSVESFASALTMDRMIVRVAEIPGERAGGDAPSLVGYVLALVLGEEGEIADLAVAPAARRHGIGRLLMSQVLGDLEARGVASVYLEVRESNTAARALYASHGFLGVGRRSGYYRQPTEDALLLKREIGPG
ncbi:MAG: ribosomal protein S18-alanine N-acetyltransferase [Gemmatimonadaceae bacterium]